jgi:hypothetical protein
MPTPYRRRLLMSRYGQWLVHSILVNMIDEPLDVHFVYESIFRILPRMGPKMSTEFGVRNAERESPVV